MATVRAGNKQVLMVVDVQLEGGATIEAANIIQELNIAMTWLAYPGRKNGTATAEQVNFAGAVGARVAS